MFTKTMTAALLGTTLLATAAFAQSPSTTTTTDRATMAPAPVTQAAAQWRASKLIGLNVYNQSNEKLGDINELLLDNSGRIHGVVIGVGGFLGVGERNVQVSFDKMQWINEPIPASGGTAMNARPGTNTPPASATPNSMTVGAASSASPSTAVRWYPDHAMYNASKDQLKAMPQFDYNTK